MRLGLKITIALLLLTTRVHAFSLLGPYADWMDKTKSYRLPGDIGGPMNIGEGYRWNIPTITYGFERSFLDYFGSNGVAAVEAAIKILNDLPPASQIDLQNYPWQAWKLNYAGQALGVIDLKSQALTMLLEQIGLADSQRYVFTMRDLTVAGSNYTFSVIMRNFDPETVLYSRYINGAFFSYSVTQNPPLTSTNVFCDAAEFLVDPLSPPYTTVSGGVQNYGHFFDALSKDDVGGIRYLLSANQIRRESLLNDIHSASGTNAIVRTAYRPGMEKLTLLRHPFWSVTGEFKTYTNRWSDAYFDGNTLAHQDVQRVTPYPDIVFTAGDLGWSATTNRTGTSSWVNHADLNGNPGGPGPGVIQPPAVLTFNNVGPWRFNPQIYLPPQIPVPPITEASSILSFAWASYDNSTNAVFVYPAAYRPFQPTQVTFRLLASGNTRDFRWQLAGPAYGQFSLQSTTNMVNWVTLTNVVNSGDPFSYQFTAQPTDIARFFRVILQP